MKKLTGVLPAVALALCLTLPTAVAAVFPDTAVHWARSSIDRWSSNGILPGLSDGSYKPDVYVTRSELARSLNNVMNYPTAASNTFYDLPSGHVNSDPLLRLVAAGVMEGYANRIRPDDSITREEAITLIAKVFRVEQSSGGAYAFSDSGKLHDWSLPYIGGLRAGGYIVGSGGKFIPEHLMTRAEIAKLFDNLIVSLYNKSGVYSSGSQKGYVIVNTSGVTLRDMTISGDLIVAPGVGNGDLILEDVTLHGRMIVEGGGQNSITIRGSSSVNTVRVDKRGGPVRIVSAESASINSVYIEDGSDSLILEGKFGSLTLGSDCEASMVSGTLNNAALTSASSRLSIGRDALVSSAKLEGEASSLSVDGQIQDVTVNCSNSSVTGKGWINRLTVRSGQNNTVTVPGVAVDVYSAAGTVNTGSGSSIAPGNSGTVPGSVSWSSDRPSVSETSYTFNLKTTSDLSIPLNMGYGVWASDGLAAVKSGGTKLTSGTDYYLSGSTLIIRQSYLLKQVAGSLSITICFNDASETDVVVSVNVIDKNIINSLAEISDIAAPAYDTSAPVTLTVASGAGYSATVTWSGLTSGKFASDTTATATVRVTPSSGYTFIGSTINATAIQGIFVNGSPSVSVSSASDDLVFTLKYSIAGPPPLALSFASKQTTLNGVTAVASCESAYQPGDKVIVTVSLTGTPQKAGAMEFKLSGTSLSITPAVKQIMVVSSVSGYSLEQSSCVFSFSMPSYAVTNLQLSASFTEATANAVGSMVVNDGTGTVSFVLAASGVPVNTPFTVTGLPYGFVQTTTVTAGSSTTVALSYSGLTYANNGSFSINVNIPKYSASTPVPVALSINLSGAPVVISAVDIEPPAPSGAATPTLLPSATFTSITSTITSVMWYDESGSEFTGTFDPSKSYKSTYIITANAGHIFTAVSTKANITLEGQAAAFGAGMHTQGDYEIMVSVQNGGNELSITILWPPTAVPQIVTNLSKPVETKDPPSDGGNPLYIVVDGIRIYIFE